MKVGDLVEYKVFDLDQGVGVITKVMRGRSPDSLSYRIEVTWHNGKVTPQYNWQVEKVS